MTDAFVVFVFLGSGFLFTSTYPLSRFKQIRSTGWILYFYTFSWGALFSLIAYFVLLLCEKLSFVQWLFDVFTQHGTTDVPHKAWCALTLILALVLGYVCSLIPVAKNKAVEKCALENPLKTKIYQSAKEGRLLQVTLTSGKVYVGSVIKSNDFEKPNTEFIVLCPLKSGYRRSETQVIKFTNNYWNYFSQYEEQLQNDQTLMQDLMSKFSVVIPMSNVLSISNYQPGAFKSINNKNASN